MYFCPVCEEVHCQSVLISPSFNPEGSICTTAGFALVPRCRKRNLKRRLPIP
jgi:hypothetical protein